MRTVLCSLLCSFAAASPAFAQADIATDEGVVVSASFYRDGELTPFFTDTDTILPGDFSRITTSVPGLPLTIGVSVADDAAGDFLDEYDAQVLFYFYYDAEEPLTLHAGDYEVVIGGLFPEGGGQFGGFDLVRGVRMTDGTDPYPFIEDYLGYSFDPVAGTLRFSIVGDGVDIDWSQAVGIVGNLTTASAVPEPASLAGLLGAAALAVGVSRRRR